MSAVMYRYPNLLSAAEVSWALRVSPSTVRRLIRRRQFPGLRVGREYRVREDDLRKFLESRIAVPCEQGA
jgi:excisionase family DNA binding protein